MEPIISPWVIYMIGIIDNLIGVSTAAAILFAGGTIMLTIVAIVFMNSNYEYNIEKAQNIKWWAKKLSFPGIVFVLITILTPSRNTIIGMTVARNLTYNRANSIITSGAELKDTIKQDVIDILRVVTNDNNNSKSKE